MAQELFHALKKRDFCGRESLAIKLDMSKAYDRLEWNFLHNVLISFGFNEGWVAMVMKLVSTVSYKFKVNGVLGNTIFPKRGLREGDPLSPYLFILAANALSHMLSRGLEERRIKGMKLARSAPTLTHLFFADDAVLFAQANGEEDFQIIQILNDYPKASGQRINLMKSGIIFGRFVPIGIRTKIQGILGMQEWDNPGKYLGLLADWGRARSAGLAWIKERVLGKIEGWKENLLHMAGKEVLIKAVLQAIPLYAMPILRFPINLCKSICSEIARFWWSSSGKRRGMHWKSWDKLTRNKMEGGLGFKDFKLMNSAHLAKQAWRAIKNPNALWVQALKAFYYPDTDFIHATRRRNDSWVWASITHGKEVVMKNVVWRVGSGESINIEQD